MMPRLRDETNRAAMHGQRSLAHTPPAHTRGMTEKCVTGFFIAFHKLCMNLKQIGFERLFLPRHKENIGDSGFAAA